MKIFHQHNIPKLVRIDSSTGPRLYETPEGLKFPSVTSVLSLQSTEHIDRWRAAVGDEQADAIARRASARGTRIHEHCEQYLLGNKPVINMFDLEMFRAMRPHLDRIDNIHCLETPLFTNTLRMAGTVDVIGEYDRTLSVIDFKTSGRDKTREDVPQYFMQTAAYAYMFWERTGISINQSVIIIGSDMNEARVFIEPVKKWLPAMISARKDYKNLYGI